MKKSTKETSIKISWQVIFYIVLFIGILFINFIIDLNEEQDELKSENNQNLEKVKEEGNNIGPHWESKIITYAYSNKTRCGKVEAEEITIAMKEIEDKTGKVVSFKEEENGRLTINCEFIEDCYHRTVENFGTYKVYTESICGYTEGVAEITENEGDIIKKANITFYGLDGFAETKSYGHGGQSGFTLGQCQRALTEIHEILHTFGYGHKEEITSIMYPEADWAGGKYTEDCKEIPHREIDLDILEDIKKTYTSF